MRPRHLLLTSKKRGWSGETAVVAALARGLAARGFEVSVATPADASLARRLVDAPVRIVPFAFAKRRPSVLWTMPREVARLRRFVAREGVALVHSHASFDTWCAALALRALGPGRAPLLVRTKHNLKRIRETALNRWYYGRAIARIVAPSEAVAAHLGASAVVPADRVCVIPNGVAAPPEGRPTRAAARAALGLAEGDEVALVASRLTARKDVATAARAVEALAARRPRLRLLVAGAGDAAVETELEVLAARSKTIALLGHVDDLEPLYAAADLAIAPARDEPFGLAPLEAMARGLPTIASDAPGHRDFAEHGGTALLFPSGDAEELAAAIDRLLDDGALRARIAAEGARVARERFSLDAMVDATVRLYESLGARA